MKLKQEGKTTFEEDKVEPIHMPSNTGQPFIMMAFMFVSGFGLVFEWMWMAIGGLLAVFVMMIIRSFDYDEGFHVDVDEIKRTERSARRL